MRFIILIIDLFEQVSIEKEDFNLKKRYYTRMMSCTKVPRLVNSRGSVNLIILMIYRNIIKKMKPMADKMYSPKSFMVFVKLDCFDVKAVIKSAIDFSNGS